MFCVNDGFHAHNALLASFMRRKTMEVARCHQACMWQALYNLLEAMGVFSVLSDSKLLNYKWKLLELSSVFFCNACHDLMNISTCPQGAVERIC